MRFWFNQIWLRMACNSMLLLLAHKCQHKTYYQAAIDELQVLPSPKFPKFLNSRCKRMIVCQNKILHRIRASWISSFFLDLANGPKMLGSHFKTDMLELPQTKTKETQKKIKITVRWELPNSVQIRATSHSSSLRHAQERSPIQKRNPNSPLCKLKVTTCSRDNLN